jgi:GntR family transcriptional regulator
MLHLRIDPHSGVPVYRQLMNQVKYYIASGTLNPGVQLPSIRQLARELAVNPTTIVRAYGELQHEGVIELRHGKGVFVANGQVHMTARQREARLRPLARQLTVEAAQMGSPPDLVLRLVEQELERLQSAEFTPKAPAAASTARKDAR